MMSISISALIPSLHPKHCSISNKHPAWFVIQHRGGGTLRGQDVARSCWRIQTTPHFAAYNNSLGTQNQHEDRIQSHILSFRLSSSVTQQPWFRIRLLFSRRSQRGFQSQDRTSLLRRATSTWTKPLLPVESLRRASMPRSIHTREAACGNRAKNHTLVRI